MAFRLPALFTAFQVAHVTHAYSIRFLPKHTKKTYSNLQITATQASKPHRRNLLIQALRERQQSLAVQGIAASSPNPVFPFLQVRQTLGANQNQPTTSAMYLSLPRPEMRSRAVQCWEKLLATQAAHWALGQLEEPQAEPESGSVLQPVQPEASLAPLCSRSGPGTLETARSIRRSSWRE